MKPNPFPGMNPWLEQHWGDVHTSLTTYARDVLQPGLPAGLRARVEEYVTVVNDDADDEHGDADSIRRYSPDVRVLERPGAEIESGGVATAVADNLTTCAVPWIVRIDEPQTSRRLKIIDTRSKNRVVTSIEFLSPSNKYQGCEQFCFKQHQMLHGGVNLVEIDLLRGDPLMTTVPLEFMPISEHHAYRAVVISAKRPRVAAVYPMRLREPLPSIRIPLRPTDSDVPLNLQQLVDLTYINGGYEDLDYSKTAIPPLSEADAEWANQVLKGKGLL